jgi:hypothetical protein
VKYIGALGGLSLSLASLWLGFYFLFDAQNQWYFGPGVITAWLGVLLGIGIVSDFTKSNKDTDESTEIH